MEFYVSLSPCKYILLHWSLQHLDHGSLAPTAAIGPQEEGAVGRGYKQSRQHSAGVGFPCAMVATETQYGVSSDEIAAGIQ